MKKVFIVLVCIVLSGSAAFAQKDSTSINSVQKEIIPDLYETVRTSVGDSNILRAYYTDTLGKLTLVDQRKEIYDRDTLFGILTGVSYPHNVLGASFFLVALDHEFIFYLDDNMKFGFRSRFVCIIDKKLFYNNRWLKDAIERTIKKDFPSPTQEDLRKFVNKKFEKS